MSAGVIKIVAQNFYSGSHIDQNWITTETLIQSVPVQSGQKVQLLNPKVKAEMGKAESFDFELQAGGSDYFDSFVQLRTYIKIVYDDQYVIFFGRVLTISNTLWGTQAVHCEGPYSFLVDSYYPYSKESSRSKISIYTYLTKILESHNYYVESNTYNDHRRAIYVGEVPGNYSNSIHDEQKVEDDTQKYGCSSWTESKSAIEDLRSYYGGFLRVRFNLSDEKCYLDWFNNYFHKEDNPNNIQSFALSQNLVDFSSDTEISNLFTAIIPVGKDNLTIDGYSENPNGSGKWLSAEDIVSVYGDELNNGYHRRYDYEHAIEKYGWIYKTVSFPTASTKKKLYEEACKWLKNNFQPSVTMYNVKAIDMRLLNENARPVLVGDTINVTYPTGSGTTRQELTVISAEYDFYNPENNSYKIGVPANTLTKLYGTSTNTSTTAGGDNTPPEENTTEYSYQDWLDRIRSFLEWHTVPGTNVHYLNYPTMIGSDPELYNAYTHTWTVCGEYGEDDTASWFDYEDVSSRGLVSWITQNDPDGDKWKQIVYGYGTDDNTLDIYVDAVKQYLTEKGLYVETVDGETGEVTRRQMYDVDHETMINIGEFSMTQVEACGLIDYCIIHYGVDLRQMTVTETGTAVKSGKVAGDDTVQLFNRVQTFVTDITNPDKITTGAFNLVKSVFFNLTRKKITVYDANGGNEKELDLNEVNTEIIHQWETRWDKTDNTIGMVIDEDGVMNAARIMLAVDPVTGDTLAEMMADEIQISGNNITLTSQDKITLGLASPSDITTGINSIGGSFILDRLEDSGQSLAALVADYITVTGQQITLTSQDKITLGLATPSDITTSINSIGGSFILDRLEDSGQSLAALVADYITVTGQQITLTSQDKITLGLASPSDITTGINSIGGSFILDRLEDSGQSLAALVADYITVTGQQITLTSQDKITLGLASPTDVENAVDEIDAYFLLDRLEESGESLAELVADYVNISASQVNITGSDLAALHVYTEDGYGNPISAGVIVTKVNGGSVRINASKITLDGTTSMTDTLYISNGGLAVASAATFQHDVTLTGNGATLHSTNVHLYSGGAISFNASSQGGSSLSLGYSDIENMIVSASVSGNTLTLIPKTGDPITFSKATSVSGAWSGSGNSQKYTVTAYQNGIDVGHRSVGFASGNDVILTLGIDATGTYEGIVANRKAVKVPMHIYTTEQGSGGGTVTTTRYSAQITVDGTIPYNNGKADGKADATVSGSWSGGVFTAYNSYDNTKTYTASITNTGHWGVEANSENVNYYYGEVKSSLNGAGTLVTTGYTYQIDATARYNAGWDAVTVTDGWTYSSYERQSNTYTVTVPDTTGNVSRTKSINLFMIQSTGWSNGSKTVYVTERYLTVANAKMRMVVEMPTATQDNWSSSKTGDKQYSVTLLLGGNAYNYNVDTTGSYEVGRQAATVSGSWSGGVFTAYNSYDNTKTYTASITNTGHWGIAANSENVNYYYAEIDSSLNGAGTLTSTGYSFQINATARYNAGRQAATVSGSWSSGVFTAYNSYDNTKTYTASITNTGHWGIAANSENVNYYYAEIYSSLNGAGTLTSTGYSFQINATARYNAGRQAATVSGSWSGGVFTAYNSYDNTKTYTASITNTGHWGIAANSENVNYYYAEIDSSLNGAGTLTSTGYSFQINATARYNAGIDSVEKLEDDGLVHSTGHSGWGKQPENRTNAYHFKINSTTGDKEYILYLRMQLEQATFDGVTQNYVILRNGRNDTASSPTVAYIPVGNVTPTPTITLTESWATAADNLSSRVNTYSVTESSSSQSKSINLRLTQDEWAAETDGRKRVRLRTASDSGSTYASVFVDMPSAVDSNTFYRNTNQYYQYTCRMTIGGKAYTKTDCNAQQSYDYGWNLCAYYVNGSSFSPITEGSNSYIQVCSPTSVTVGGSNNTYTYTTKTYSMAVYASDPDWVYLYYTNVSPNVPVAKLDHHKYTAGRQAATVSVSSTNSGWSSGVFTAYNTYNSANKATTSLSFTGHWGNTSNSENADYYYYDIKASVNGSSTLVSTGATSYINAVGRYNAGWNAVAFTGHTWNITSESSITNTNYAIVSMSATKSNVARTYTNVIFTMTQDSSFNSTTHKKYAYVRAGSGSSGSKIAKLEIDASAVWTAGYGSINNPNSGYYAGYMDGKAAGWKAYYDDALDWISAYSEGNNTYSVWIPKRNLPDDGIYSGDGSSGTCEKWFQYTTGSSSTPPYSPRFVDSGSAPSSSISQVLTGYTMFQATGVGNSQNQTYRYIRFTVDGHRIAVYFS